MDMNKEPDNQTTDENTQLPTTTSEGLKVEEKCEGKTTELLDDENVNKEEEVVEVEEILSEEVKEQRHQEAVSCKEQGNAFFKSEEFEQAVDKYTEGIETCPKSFPKTLAVLLSNRAACHMKTDEKEKAIADCTDALENDKHYTKARIRRAQMFEASDKLDEALKDYNEILSYDLTCKIAGEASMRLPKQIQERNEKLKEEMMGKLKELGNMCLKPFGLSTQNFQFQQDPNTGGYSVNFQK